MYKIPTSTIYIQSPYQGEHLYADCTDQTIRHEDGTILAMEKDNKICFYTEDTKYISAIKKLISKN